MSRKKHISLAIVSMFILLAMAISGTALYLTDRDAATNTVTVGDIKIDLQEPNWRDTYDVVPNQELRKDPQIKNTGVNDAIVFITVEVPVEEITVTADNGTKGTKGPSELVWFKDTSDGSSTHANNFDSNWVHLDTEDIGADLSKSSRTYVFAYKVPLAANQTTSALFDKIQVKNFIENEIMAGIYEDIHINAYGIQASDVLESGVDLTKNLSTANLTKIYNIYLKQSGNIKNYYYSTLNLAVTDANALTTANADLPTKDGAACALHINGDTAHLELLKDVSSNSVVKFTENAEFNLTGHKIDLAANCHVSAAKKLTIKNGTIENENNWLVLGAASSSEQLNVFDIDLKASFSNSIAVANLQSQKVIIDGLDVDVTASLTGTNTGVGVLLVNNAQAEIDHCNVNISGTHSSQLDGISLQGTNNAAISNTTINVDCNSNNSGTETNQSEGILLQGASNTTINNTTVNTNEASASSSVLVKTTGIRILQNSNAIIENSNINVHGDGNVTSCGVYVGTGTNGQIFNSDININTKNTTGNNTVFGVNAYKSQSARIEKSNITVSSENAATNTQFTGFCNNATTAQISETNITVDTKKGYSYGVASVGNGTTKINGGEIFEKRSETPNGSGDSSGTGILVKDSSKLIVGDVRSDTIVSGGNNAIGTSDTCTVDVYSGLFKSPNHGGMYVATKGNINIHGGTFMNITDPADPNYSSQISHFGGLYVYSDAGNVNIENATIIGGQHGLRIKSNNGGSTAHVTIDNSSVSGQINAFSIDNGTLEIGSGVTTSYSANDIQRNGGTVIDHRS